MFKKENVEATLDKLTFRKPAKREKDTKKEIEVTFGVPLGYRLANQVSAELGDDLYKKVNDEWKPRPEMTDSSFALQPKTWLMEMRSHPEVERAMKLSGITTRNVNASKNESNEWILYFTVQFVLVDPKEALILIRHLWQNVYLTFEEQEPEMAGFDGEPAPGTDKTADVNPRGEVEKISDRKPRRTH